MLRVSVAPVGRRPPLPFCGAHQRRRRRRGRHRQRTDWRRCRRRRRPRPRQARLDRGQAVDWSGSGGQTNLFIYQVRLYYVALFLGSQLRQSGHHRQQRPACLPCPSFSLPLVRPSVRPSVSLLSSLLSLLFCDSDRSDRMDGRGRSGAFKGLLGQERENQLHKYLHGNDFIFEIKPRTPTFFLGLIPWCGYLVHFMVLIAHSKYVCTHMCLPYCLSAVL